MKRFLFIILLVAFATLAAGCNPLSFLYQLHASNVALLNQPDNDTPPDIPLEPTVTITPDPTTTSLTSGLPYNPGANPGLMSLFGKWKVEIIRQNINNNTPLGRRMAMKGKTLVIEPGGDYMPGQPPMSGKYFEDYGTEYVDPDYFRYWFEEASSGSQNLGQAENAYGNAFQSFQNVNLSQLTCQHSGMTEGKWKFHMVPYTTDSGITNTEVRIAFYQEGDADLSSRCGYNFNNEGAFQIESSGWRSNPIGENDLYNGPFSIFFPNYMDNDYNTIILENDAWEITITRIQ